MTPFEELYRNFIKTPAAKEAIQQVKRLHPETGPKQAADAAKALAEAAFELKYEGYFNPAAAEGAVSRNWNNLFRGLIEVAPEKLPGLAVYAKKYAKEVMPGAKTATDEAMYRAIFALSARSIDLYAPQADNDKIHRVMLSACKKITSADNDLGRGDKYTLALFTFSNLYQGNPQAYFNRLGMIGKAIDKLDDKKNITKVCEEIDAIYQNEGHIGAAAAKGFENYVIPLVNKTPGFAQLAAEHDCGFGEYGLIGYTTKVMTAPWTPKDLTEALSILKEVPTPDMLKRENNRRNAILIEEAQFLGLRDVIHSENIGVEQLVDNMVSFYEAAKSHKSTDAAKARMTDLLKNYQGADFTEIYTDLKRYDKPLEGADGRPAIELLYELQRDLKKSDSRPPLVGNPKLDQLSQQFEMDGYVNPDKFGAFLAEVNNTIIDNIGQKKNGIEPPMVDLLFWCDKKSGNILKSRDFEEQCGDYKTGWFKEVVLFSELTNNTAKSFNREEFDRFYDKAAKEDYFFDAYDQIIQRKQKHIMRLDAASKTSQKKVAENLRSRLEKSKKSPDEIDFEVEKINRIFSNRQARIFSNNLLGEIMHLTDFKKPSTRIGERYAEKMQHKRLVERPAEIALSKMFNYQRHGQDR